MKTIRKPELPSWATLSGLTCVWWPLGTWKPVPGEQATIRLEGLLEGTDTFHILWMNPNCTLNGWAAERPEDLLEVRIVEVRLTADIKDLGPEIAATVDILSSVDPWEFAKLAPPTAVGPELDFSCTPWGTTELLSLGDRTVISRDSEGDYIFDYLLFGKRSRIALLADLQTERVFFAGHGILQEGQLAKMIGPPKYLNSRTVEESDWLYPAMLNERPGRQQN